MSSWNLSSGLAEVGSKSRRSQKNLETNGAPPHRIKWRLYMTSAEVVDYKSLKRGSLIDVETRNRHYRIECLGGSAVRICGQDRKSTRLNSSHSQISYAVFCLKKKK